MNFGAEQAIGLEEKLKSGKKLNVKLGFDPTSPDLHLGHYIVLRGAKKFQEKGHNVTIIVGDFTAAIGDPSGRNKLRPALTESDIEQHAQTYMDQVFMVLDEAKTKIQKNSDWLGKMSIKDTLALLSSVTLSQMLVRDDFRNRFEAQTPIFMHEMVYPLMQGLDSVAIKADVELGGTDQTFNLMMGRELQKNKCQEEQAVLTFPLLVGLDGKKKMSKSLGNHIGLRDTPTDKFGKIMSISDETMWNYWKVLIGKADADIQTMKDSNENPKNIKMELAKEVVGLFHGFKIAEDENEKFIERFSKKNITDITEVEVLIENNEIGLGHLMKDLDLATSVSDANRKIEQKGVRVNYEIVDDKTTKIQKNQEFVLQVGKLQIRKVKIK
jgi:tyrosyl-tRNA synthetase